MVEVPKVSCTLGQVPVTGMRDGVTGVVGLGSQAQGERGEHPVGLIVGVVRREVQRVFQEPLLLLLMLLLLLLALLLLLLFQGSLVVGL